MTVVLGTEVKTLCWGENMNDVNKGKGQSAMLCLHYYPSLLTKILFSVADSKLNRSLAFHIMASYDGLKFEDICFYKVHLKGKVIPLQARCGPEGG